MNTAVLVTCIRNFRGSRGPVSGVLKGFVGLSTAIFTDLCSALFADDPASFLVMLAVVPAAVCALAMVFLRKAANADAENTLLDDSTTTTPLLLASKPAAAEARGPGERPRLGEEHTIAEALSALDFWLLFSSFLMGVGTGLAVMNNLGQMGVAMGYADVSLFVSMTSIWGFFGRIASGTISEHFIKYVTTTAPLLQLTFLHYYSPQLMNNRRHE
jgi:hypothetical protein